MTQREARGVRRGVLGTLFRYEMKMLLRDRRTLLAAVGAPLVLFPVLLLVMRGVERSETRRLARTTYRYAVVGDRAGWARGLVESALARDTAGPDSSGAAASADFQEMPQAGGHADSLLQAGDLHLVVEGLSADSFRTVLEQDTAWWGSGEEPDSAELAEREEELASPVPVMRLHFRGDSDFSRSAATRLQRELLGLRSELRDSVFRARGFPVDPGAVAEVETVNTASAARSGGALLGEILLPLLLLLMLTGGSIAAADAIAGEKERGTLETLLTTAARRSEIVSAKQLAIIVVGLAVALITVLEMLAYLRLGLIELPEDFAVSISAVELVVLLLLLVPLAVLVSNALLLLSGYARSYREYQIYFFPLLLVVALPSAVSFLPGLELRSVIALVPVAGISVAVREIMVGEYDPLALMLAFVSTSLAAVWISRLTERTLSTERLISAADLEEADLVGGAGLFRRRVLGWFLGLWALFFVVSLWFGEDLGIRGQALVNLLVIFLGGITLMIRRYRLPVRETLALRAPHPLAWVAVLIGAPSAYVVGLGVAELVNTWLFPVPRQLLEAFGEMMLGQAIPLWQLVLLLAVLPGVVEELTFRGVLLYGLRRRLRPWALCLAVGAIFGFFHVSLFRIIPTAFLGALLAGVVLLTGSIFPAMLWHGLNNAIALVPAHLGWIDADATIPVLWYPLAILGLGVAFGILWLVRRPHPGPRGRREPPPDSRPAREPAPAPGRTGASPRDRDGSVRGER